MEEIWKKHPLIDDRYEFSNLGNFKNITTNIILKQTHDVTGGVATLLKLRNSKQRRRFKLHRIVAELFVPNPEPQTKIRVKHLDDNRKNNMFSNLVWVTDLESVNIDIQRQARNYSSAQKLSLDEVIKVRDEFDTTDINIHDLANKYHITTTNLLKILKYETFQTIEPERKKTYKIISLNGDEYEDFYKRKLSHKTSLAKRNKNEILRVSRKSISKCHLKEDIFKPIYDDFVNSGLDDVELLNKYQITIAQLNYNIKIYIAPTIRFLENEELVRFRRVWVSTHGRIFNESKSLVLPKSNLKSISMFKDAAKTLARTYLNLSQQTKVCFINGDETDFSLKNLKVVPLYEKTELSQEIIDEIKNEYINTPIIHSDLIKKYNIKQSELNRFILGVKKINICSVCETKNKTEFIRYNKPKTCDKCYEKNPKLYKNLSDEDKKLKIAYSKNWINENPIRTKLSGARNRAMIKGFEFELDEDFLFELYIKQGKNCYYSGLPISLDNKNNMFSIDRIDSDKGYLKSNVCLTLEEVNIMKMDLSLDRFMTLVKSVYNHSARTHNEISVEKFLEKIFLKKGSEVF